MNNYYGLDGSPITFEEYVTLIESGSKIIKQEEVGKLFVSTVWLGLNHNFGEGDPLIFETMVFEDTRSYSDIYCERYKTMEEALAGHEEAVQWAAVRQEL